MEDKIIKRAVENALDWEPSLDAANVSVAVKDGVVTLGGHVSTYAQKVVANRAASRVRAVRALADEIEVRLDGAAEGDEAIARKAATLIDWDVTLPHDAVKVAVSKGVVTLTGDVPWQYQRLAAERGIHRLDGVRRVDNQIVVKPQVRADDLKRRIEEALEREADVDAYRISVNVEGGKVRLEGKVRGWFEREAAERAAWAAPGVVQVEDQVTIGS